MLTPDEMLGLAGRSLDGRVRRALHALPPAAHVALEARLKQDAAAAGLLYERDEPDGSSRIDTIRVMSRPLVVLPAQLAYLHHVTLQIVDALEQLPAMYRALPEVRRTLPLGEDEVAFLESVHDPAHGGHVPLYPRLDAVVDLASGRWKDTLSFVEANLGGVGGIHIAPVAEELVWRDVVPLVDRHDPTLRLALPRDQRQLFLQVLLDHAARIGRTGGTIALLEPCYVSGGPVEQSHLLEHLSARFQAKIVHADPRDLRERDGEVWLGDDRIDVAYRDYEVRDLLAVERDDGVDLGPIKRLFRENRIISGVGGEFDHKSSFELLTDPDFAARHFSPEERRIFAKHVSWTRLLSQRATVLWDGRQVDLPTFARDHREELVLKPNRGYGGAGILIGPSTDEATWAAAVDAALANAADPHRGAVVQRLVELPVNDFPVVDERGHVHDEPFFTVMGFAPTSGGMGILCRASQKQVVNVAQRGGVVAVLQGEMPESLRGPVQVQRGRATEESLRDEVHKLLHLDGAIDLLGWDEETVLPSGARRDRGEQLATLERLRHGLLASPWLGDLLAERRAVALPDSEEAAELDLLVRRRAQALCVPESLVQAFAEARSASLAAWEDARAHRDLRRWLGPLDHLLRLVRDRGTALANGGDGYDALLDQFDPGLTRARVTPLLTSLRDALQPIVAAAATDAPLPDWRTRPLWPDAAQDTFCRQIITAMGFDWTRGRLDRSTHPFTLAAGPNDIRMTFRVDPRDPFQALFGAMHEAGHALYDQGFQARHQHSLLGSAPGMAIHESQARLWENRVGRGAPFWTYFSRVLRDHFPEAARVVTPPAWLAELSQVRRSPVRVGADEATYDLHILLRYRLELALFDGSLAVRDLAAAWNEGMQELLGLLPANDLEGCLQDVHWAIGSFGYFPSYTLGNLYAAQLYDAFLRDTPLAEAQLAQGDLAPLLTWLRAKVHAHGHRFTGEQLVTRATGSAPTIAPFVAYLLTKYLPQ
jgi:carboxypeptidase Taq